MTYSISNAGLTAVIDSMGAQLISLRSPAHEYLWVADEKYWHEHAPVLFPIVGALRDGKTRIGGSWYRMGRHGFAKRSQFALSARTDASVSLTLTETPETLEVYPFKFRLTVTYTLTGGGIETAFRVENTGSAPLPYSIGGHPGFNIPAGEEAAFEDYTIQFPEDEEQSCPVIDLKAGLIDWSSQGFRLSSREIPLRHDLFYQDALVFEGLNSACVRIINKSTGRGVEMDFTGFPMLGIWSAVNDGPYVCLEPWTGCATLTTEGDEFVEKKGMTQLQPGETGEHKFTVNILGM